MRSVILCSLMIVMATVTGAPAATPALSTEEEKVFYAIGLALVRDVGPFNLSEAELQLVIAGLTDAVLRRQPRVEVQAYRTQIRELQASRARQRAETEKKASAGFLATAAAEPGATKTPSGLVYKSVVEGTGPAPTATDRVKVHYTGRLIDGTVFDSSVERGSPATFQLTRVIRCWTEGLQLMKAGGKSRLVCPADVAYGDRGQPPRISPGATLVFDVELIEIVK